MIKKLKKNRLFVNSFFLILSALTHSVSGFLFYIIAARLFSAEDLGLSVSLLTGLSLIMVLSQFGFSESIIKFYKPFKNKNSLLGTGIFISGILSIFFGIIVLIIICLHVPQIKDYFLRTKIFFLLFVLMSLIWTISTLFDSIYIAIGKSKYVFLKTIIYSIFKLLLPLIALPLGFFGIYCTWVISSMLSLIFLQLFKKIKFKIELNRKIIKKVISFSFVNYISNIFYWLRNFVVPLIITVFFGAASAAFFFVPLRILDLMIIVPKSTGRALFAENSKNKNYASAMHAYILSILSSVFFIFIFFFAGEKILSIYGTQYVQGSLDILKVLSIYGLFMALNEILLAQAQKSSNYNEILSIRVVSSLLAIFSILYFIRFGLLGFAYSFIFGEIIAFAIVSIGRLIIKIKELNINA